MTATEVTMYGLQHWYHAEFEKLGWMVLAQSEGRLDKVEQYKKGLMHLLASIEAKMAQVLDVDKKADLAIMMKKVTILKNHVEKDFPSVSLSTATPVLVPVKGGKKSSKK
jgi:hypothetical protein